MRAFLVFGLALLFPSESFGQVPDGFGVRFSAFTIGPPGVEFVDLSGASPAIRAGGLVGMSGFRTGAIDPVSGDLWVGDCSPSTVGGRLIQMSLSGTTIVSQTVIVDTGTGMCLIGIAFDQAGDLFISDNSSLWKIDRATNALTLWDTNSYSGVFSAMSIDPTTNRLWLGTADFAVPASQIIEYDLSAGPGPGTVIADLAAFGVDDIWDLAFDGVGTLYCASRQPNTVFAFNLSLGIPTPVLGAPSISVSALVFDPRTGLLHTSTFDVVQPFTPLAVWNAIDLSSGTTTLVEQGYLCSSACPSVTAMAIPREFPQSLSVCSGDGGNQGACTSCPCGNDSPAGTIGGCLNGGASSALLQAEGSPSVTLPPLLATDLRFFLTEVPPMAFSILSSGDALEPTNPANPCFGLGSGVNGMGLDGLRCVALNLRRHGGRAADQNGSIGETTSPWGGEGAPPSGIARAGAGFQAGQTRFFQATYRTDPLLTCMRGLNTSQAVQVTFIP